MIGENLRKAPLIRIVIPFGAGIAMGTMFQNSINLKILILNSLFVFILLFTSWFYPRAARLRWVFGLVLSFSFILLGIIYYSLYQLNLFSAPPGTHALYCQLQIKEHVKINDDWNVFYAEGLAEKNDNNWSKIDVRLQLYISRKLKPDIFIPGDKVVLKARAIRTAAPTNPLEFNYRKFLDQKGIWGSIYIKDSSSIIKVIPANDFSLEKITFILQTKFLSIFRKFEIAGDELALLSALTIGVRDQIDNEINKAFSASGAMHILSVSGLHVGIVYMVFARLLSLLGRNRFTKILSVILQIGFLWFYAFLTGLSPAVNRAAAMFSFLAIGKSLNRSASSLNIVAGSAFILLLFNPFLIFDMGFELSYLAVISIILFQPFISGLFEFKNYLLSQIWDLTALSVAAQIGTFPLSIVYFHQFPNYFILTNLIVVPLAAIILYLSIAMAFFYWIPYLSSTLAWILKISLKGMIFSVLKIEHLPYSVWQNISINTSQLVILYVLILLFAGFLHFRHRSILFYTLCTFSVFLFSILITDLNLARKQNFIVFNIRGSSLIMIHHGKDAMVIFSGKNPKLPNQALTLSKGITIEWKISNTRYNCIDSLAEKRVYSAGKNIEVARNGSYLFIRNGDQHYGWRNMRNHKEIELKLKLKDSILPDIIVAANITRKRDLEILKQSRQRMLVFDSSCKELLVKLIPDSSINKEYITYDVKGSGAFIYNKK